MDIAGIKASTAEVLAALPGLEGFAEGTRLALTASVQAVVTAAIAEVADGISQIVALGQSVDGATVSLEIETIVIPPIRAKLTVSMPLKPSNT
jgi:hypothetical protein